MDMVTLAMAKKYADSQRLGYAETPALTFNGDPAGKETTENGSLVKISDEVFDLQNITRLFATDGEQTVEMPLSDLTYLSNPAGGQSAYAINDNLIVLAAEETNVNNIPKGIYVAANDDFYVSRLDFGETIHPIDPKFIPGAVLPVVELSTVLSSTTTALTDAENVAMKTAFDSGLPVVIKCDFIISSVEFTDAKLVFMVATSEGVNAFRASVGNNIMQIFSSDGISWSGLVFET